MSETRPAEVLDLPLNDTIRAELARRNVTQAEAGRALGLSRVAIHRRLSGAVSWNVDELTALAALLDVAVRDLFPSSH